MKKYLSILKHLGLDSARKILSPMRRRKLGKKDFSIISNNCWAGKVYQRFGLEYLTPTVGCYFFAEDYLLFLSKLEYYLSIPIEIITVEQSKHRDYLVSMKQSEVPIGRLDDVEIVFLHYKNGEEAVNKWERRRKRVNFNNLIIKFSKMNECSDEDLTKFDKLNYGVKFVFVNDKKVDLSSAVYIKGYDDKIEIIDDTTKYSKYVDLVSLINDGKIISLQNK